MQLENLARLRQLAYRLFSSTLLYPDESRLKAITAAAIALHEQNDFTNRFAFASTWRRFLTLLTELPEQQFLEEEYILVFLHNPERAPCLPYESAHLDPTGRAAGWVLALLEQEYAAAGLALSPSLKDLPDHVAVELEFMAFMCGQEADAWNQEIIRQGIRALEQQAAFLSAHLARWFPDWARRVSTADGRGIYSLVAEMAWAFISHDQDLVGILLDKFHRIPEASETPVAERMVAEKQ